MSSRKLLDCLINLSFILISRLMQKHWLQYKQKKVLVNAPIKGSLKDLQDAAKREFKSLSNVEPSKLILQYDAVQIKTTNDFSRALASLKLKKANEATFTIKMPEGQQSDGEQSQDSERSPPSSDDQAGEEGEDFDSNEEVHGSEKGGDSEEAHQTNKKAEPKQDSEQGSEESEKPIENQQEEEQEDEDEEKKEEEEEEEEDEEEEEEEEEEEGEEEEGESSQGEKPVDVQHLESSQQQAEQPQAIIDNNSKPKQPKPQQDPDSEPDQLQENDQQQYQSSSSEEENQDVKDEPQENNQDSEGQGNQSEDVDSIQSSSQAESEGDLKVPPIVFMPDSQDEHSQDKDEIVDEPQQTPPVETKQNNIEAPKPETAKKKKAIQKPKVTELPSSQLKMVGADNRQISAIKQQKQEQRQTTIADKNLIGEINKPDLLLAEIQNNMGLILERLATLQREKSQQSAEPTISTGCNGCGLLNTKLTRKKIGKNFLNIYFCDDCDSKYQVSLRQK